MKPSRSFCRWGIFLIPLSVTALLHGCGGSSTFTSDNTANTGGASNVGGNTDGASGQTSGIPYSGSGGTDTTTQGAGGDPSGTAGNSNTGGSSNAGGFANTGGSSAAGASGQGGAPGAGGATGQGGSLNISCDTLAARVTEKLKEAQRCTVNANPSQCQNTAMGECYCPVVVADKSSPATAAYLQALRDYQTHCRHVCPLIACRSFGPGTCQAQQGSSVGTCTAGGPIPIGAAAH